MTAQEPFHNFFSRTGRSPLRRVVLVALIHDLDLLAEIVWLVGVRTLRYGLGLAVCHGSILRRWTVGGNRRNRRRRPCIKSFAPTFVGKPSNARARFIGQPLVALPSNAVRDHGGGCSSRTRRAATHPTAMNAAYMPTAHPQTSCSI
jgi:hypothetical protein